MSQNTAIPKLCETDEIPLDEKLIHQVWTIPSVNFVWLVAELDMQTGEAFGYANLNDDQMAEWGYIDINDIRKNDAILTNTAVRPFKEMIHITRPKNGCPKCGSCQYGCHAMKSDIALGGDDDDDDGASGLWICKNCNYRPFANIRGSL